MSNKYYVVVFGQSPIRIMTLIGDGNTMLSIWIKDRLTSKSAAILLVDNVEEFERKVSDSGMESQRNDDENKALLVLKTMLDIS